MREVIRVGKGDLGRGSSRDYAVKRGIIKLTGNEKGAPHLIEMGHEVAYGRDKGVGIVDFHGIDAAGVAIDEVGSRERQLAINGLPGGNAIRASKNAAFIKQGILTASIKASHASDGVGPIGRVRIGEVTTRRRRGAGKAGIEHENVRRIHVGAVVPDVSDDDASERTGKIHPHAARGIIGRVKPDGNGIDGRLACCRVGRFAGRHGHDLLAHDHEAVVEDAHHHDQEDGEDEGEFDEGLAFASPPPDLELLEVRKSFHGSFV